MVRRVENFVYNMLTKVLQTTDTAPLVIGSILETGTYDPGPKVERIENPDEWTREIIREKALLLDSDRGPEGDFDD
jgi:hypothetical protein